MSISDFARSRSFSNDAANPVTQCAKGSFGSFSTARDRRKGGIWRGESWNSQCWQRGCAGYERASRQISGPKTKEKLR
jgi:hypothetical protein